MIVLMCLTLPVHAGDPTSPFSADDPTMNRAIKTAQDTLPGFIAFLQKNPDQVEYASFKVAIKGTDYVEHIWVNNLKGLGNTTVEGTLNNNPNNLSGKRLGSKVKFSLSSVSDWSLYRNGEGYGSYTLRVIAKQLKGKDRQSLETYLSDKPLPGLW
jgi:uncharacterized protein YegJ (DUF2314 family)